MGPKFIRNYRLVWYSFGVNLLWNGTWNTRSVYIGDTLDPTDQRGWSESSNIGNRPAMQENQAVIFVASQNASQERAFENPILAQIRWKNLRKLLGDQSAGTRLFYFTKPYPVPVGNYKHDTHEPGMLTSSSMIFKPFSSKIYKKYHLEKKLWGIKVATEVKITNYSGETSKRSR